MGCGGSSGKKKQEADDKTSIGPRTPTEAERMENRKHRLKSRQAWKTEEVPGEEGLPKDPLERAKKKGKVVPEVREAMDTYEWAEGQSPRAGNAPMQRTSGAGPGARAPSDGRTSPVPPAAVKRPASGQQGEAAAAPAAPSPEPTQPPEAAPAPAAPGESVQAT